MHKQIKKNILHLYTEMNYSCGISKTIKLIIKNSNKFNHKLFLIGGDALDSLDESVILFSLDKKYKPSLFLHLKIFFLLVIYCSQNNISILHSHHRFFDFHSFLVSKLFRIKTITSVQSIVYNKKLLSYKAEYLIACSHAVRKHLINYFLVNKSRIKVIYNFVDQLDMVPLEEKKQIRHNLSILANTLLFGYFGRIDFHEKQTDKLIILFQKIINKYSNVSLLLIGGGENYGEAIKVIGKESRIQLHHSKPDIKNYYQILDYFILPSKVEPFGIVLIEAGINSVPVIASNADGIPEVIKNGTDGILFNNNNFNELEDIIIKIIKGKIITNNFVINFHQKIMNNFTSDQIIPKYEAYYSEILK